MPQETQEKVDLSGGVPSAEEQRALHGRQMAMAAATGAEDEIQVPVASVAIPSRGRIYPVDSPLHNRGEIDIKSMTAREEDILTSMPLLRQGRAMSALLRSCIIDKSVDPEEMLVGDRNAVLIAIRVSGYGAEYEGKLDCPSCDESFEHTFGLGHVPMKHLEVEPVEEGRNLFYFELPVLKKRIVFKLLTGAEERELNTLQDRSKKARGAGAQESNVTMRLLHQIVSIGGVNDRQKLAKMVRNMPARDSLELRKYIDRISPGVELKDHVTCPSCGEESEVDVPFGADFFWPELGS